ncbi:MAG: M23 family metallopeptidase, partial [Lachnospiraceae bacterium]|nr:M23 family metallopeptidase [Lachnospiraceae bacterium]
LESAVFVLAALTVTGLYVRKNNRAEQDNYVVDFGALEQSSTELAENMISGEELDTLFADVGTDDLDYDPSFQEANSLHVENTESEQKKEKTSGSAAAEKKQSKEEPKKDDPVEKSSAKKQESATVEEEGMFDETVDTVMSDEVEAVSATVQPELNFNEEDGLVWPIVGDVLINYSMDKTIYFPTLDQYKYNPAIVIAATQGEQICAAADGRVTSVSYDPNTGNTVVMELGNGYELTYGQLENITVSEGSYVNVGDGIGTVATPTKYYSTEGTNVYFKLTKDGEPVNPLSKLQ